jgi:electron transport complex protein RnfD
MTDNGKVLPPHIYSSENIAKITGVFLLSLLPMIVFSSMTFGWPAVRLFGLSALATIMTEWIVAGMSGRKAVFADGSGFLTAILIAAMLPVHLPLLWVVAGCVASVLIGKEIFGGFAANPFHPAMVGIGFLTAVCPGFFDAKGLSFSFAGSHFLSDFLTRLPAWLTVSIRSEDAGLLVNTSLAAILIGAAMLLAWKLIRWESPFVYLAVLSAGMGLQSGSLLSGLSMLRPIDYLVAFFVITDFVTTPVTPSTQILFAVTAGLCRLLFRHAVGDLPAIIYSVLLANALVPWMDEWGRPRGSRFCHPWEEIVGGLKLYKKTSGRR